MSARGSSPGSPSPGSRSSHGSPRRLGVSAGASGRGRAARAKQRREMGHERVVHSVHTEVDHDVVAGWQVLSGSDPAVPGPHGHRRGRAQQQVETVVVERVRFAAVRHGAGSVRAVSGSQPRLGLVPTRVRGSRTPLSRAATAGSRRAAVAPAELARTASQVPPAVRSRPPMTAGVSGQCAAGGSHARSRNSSRTAASSSGHGWSGRKRSRTVHTCRTVRVPWRPTQEGIAVRAIAPAEATPRPAAALRASTGQSWTPVSRSSSVIADGSAPKSPNGSPCIAGSRQRGSSPDLAGALSSNGSNSASTPPSHGVDEMHHGVHVAEEAGQPRPAGERLGDLLRPPSVVLGDQ